MQLSTDPLGGEMKLKRSIVSAVALLLVAAAEVYPVNWAHLEAAWSKYLGSPSSATAGSIVSLLPPGKRASHNVADFDVKAAIRILDRLGELERLIAAGSPHSFEVAFALREISDGEYSEWLSEMLGSSIRTHPLPLLSSLKANKGRVSASCLFADATDPDEFDTREKYVAEIQARRSSLVAISAPELEEQSSCLVAQLDRALAR